LKRRWRGRMADETVEETFSDGTLFPLPEAKEPKPAPPTRPEVARVYRAVRDQLEWMPRTLDSLLPQDHQARAIWQTLDLLDLAAFYASIKAILGHAGHPTTDPKVLLALWLYATTEGIGSARELDRLCDEHDAYRWLRGGVPINYHMLSDFRVANQAALDDLLTEILASMMLAGLVTLRHVAQDGMRTRASAGASSFRSEETLLRCLEEARAQVERLAKEREAPDPEVSKRERAARERAAREREARIAEAIRRLPEVKEAKARQGRTLAKDKRAKVTKARVSTTDPDARVMKMPNGGFNPALNLELASDVDSQVIVGVGVVTKGSDGGQAWPMLEQVERRLEKARQLVSAKGAGAKGAGAKDEATPGQALEPPVATEATRVPEAMAGEVAEPTTEPTTEPTKGASTPRALEGYLIDGSFATRDDITKIEQARVTVYAPTRPPRTTTSGRSKTDPRPDDTPEVAAWRVRMESPEAKAVYKERAATAECVNAHARRYGLERLLVRGVDKVLCVLLLVAIARDLSRWIALGAQAGGG
jgi:transposase